MTKSITREDFYKLFQESERQRQETERILRESFQRFQEETECVGCVTLTHLI